MNARTGRVLGRFAGVDQRWRNAPIRTRMTAAAAVSATFAIIAVVAVAYIAVHHELYSNIDGQLRHQSANQHSIRFDPQSLQPEVARDPDQSSGSVQVVDIAGN